MKDAIATSFQTRVSNLAKGQIWISDDFNAPLPEEFWLGSIAGFSLPLCLLVYFLAISLWCARAIAKRFSILEQCTQMLEPSARYNLRQWLGNEGALNKVYELTKVRSQFHYSPNSTSYMGFKIINRRVQ